MGDDDSWGDEGGHDHAVPATVTPNPPVQTTRAAIARAASVRNDSGWGSDSDEGSPRHAPAQPTSSSAVQQPKSFAMAFRADDDDGPSFGGRLKKSAFGAGALAGSTRQLTAPAPSSSGSKGGFGGPTQARNARAPARPPPGSKDSASSMAAQFDGISLSAKVGATQGQAADSVAGLASKARPFAWQEEEGLREEESESSDDSWGDE